MPAGLSNSALLPPQIAPRNSWSHIRQKAIRSPFRIALQNLKTICHSPDFPGNSANTLAAKESQPTNVLRHSPLMAAHPQVRRVLVFRVFSNQTLFGQTMVTSTPASFKTRRSDFEMPRSVITCCIADVSIISERLRLPNLLESHTATVRLAISAIIRFTFDSSKLGVLSP